MNNEIFKKNLEKWSYLNEEAAKKIEGLECNEVLLCQNSDGEWNLKKKSPEGEDLYFHSQESPLKEAQQWFLSLDLNDVAALYIYGIGLGYYYDMIKPWLKENRIRQVIFCEDNLEVIKQFLSTERATEFLKDPQVKLFSFSWENSFLSFGFITSLYPLLIFRTTALRLYEKTDPKRIVEFRARISFFNDTRLGMASEFLNLTGSMGFIQNYYQNLLLLPDSKLEFLLTNQFAGVPAIICGAGPSLAKNMGLLKELQDKALIMAGGTAMNVLNGAGITPHFGLGIDPNTAHFNRLISNTAFEVPFFYRQRMYNKALKMVHGEHIYVGGAGGYRLPEWYEDQLEIPHGDSIEEGHNVVNFNLSIAKELGCNPILLVGVDLAYSNNESYAPGLTPHAIQDPKTAFLTKYNHEELLVKNDIYGKPVNTLWKWVNESMWFTQFTTRYPHIILVNCTEGGIGFQRVPNMPLSDAVGLFFRKNYDFSSLIHGAVQNSCMPKKLTQENIDSKIEKMEESLLACEKYCNDISFEKSKHMQSLQMGGDDPDLKGLDFTIIDEKVKLLEEEVGYQYLLQDYKERYLEIYYPKLEHIECDPSQTQKIIQIKKTFFDLATYHFLGAVAKKNILIMQSILSEETKEKKNACASKKVLQLKEWLENERKNAQKNEEYSFDDQRLKIVDLEMGLDIQDFSSCMQERSFYPSGKTKTEVYHHIGKLHGPSRYYSEMGQLLSQNWYVQGNLEGKGFFYYPTGELYAIRRYKNNCLHGRQEYYYSNGFPKSILHFHEGKIDGKNTLYYENGRIKRELHYKKEKKDGQESLWDENGLLVLEAYYCDNKAVGVAREWYPNGILAKEITYQADGDEFEIREWKENGEVIFSSQEDKDYLDQVVDQSKTLNTSLLNVYKSLVNIAPLASKSEKSEEVSIEENLLALKQKIDKLNQYGREILEISGEGNTTKEPIWKTPEAERILRSEIRLMTDGLKEVTMQTDKHLKELLEKLSRHLQEPENKDKKTDDKQ